MAHGDDGTTRDAAARGHIEPAPVDSLTAAEHERVTTAADVERSLDALGASIDRLRADRDDLLAALRDVLAYFDAGAFVRNTDSDGCSDWALKAAGPLKALAVAQAVVSKAEGR
jgi:hypothetical protein